MNKRKVGRKLELARETLRILDDAGLKQVVGGQPQPTAATCFITCICNTTLQGCVVEEF